MADYGAIAVHRGHLTPLITIQRQAVCPNLHRTLRVLGGVSEIEQLCLAAGRDDDEGTPAAPSLYLPHGGLFRLRFPVEAGSRSITIKAKQPSATLPRPTARLLANATIGLASDLTATAPTGAGWVTIGPLSFVAAASGGVFMELYAPWSGGEAGCWFDLVVVK